MAEENAKQGIAPKAETVEPQGGKVNWETPKSDKEIPLQTTAEPGKDLKYPPETDILKISGGRITDSESPQAEAHAGRYYGLVRSMQTDTERISKNIGVDESVIRGIKNFIFMDEHDLGNGVIKRFDPDCAMAQSWQRLIQGNPLPHDLTLIQHEIMENQLMESGMTQDEAHIETSKVYNYSKESSDYYGNLKEHKDKP
jgi:hypothetical protein